jgi:hypothetical protein
MSAGLMAPGYDINRINVTLTLGGRFRYLWITDIENKNFVSDNRHDMSSGLSLTAVYTFNFTDTAEKKPGDSAPLPQLM